MLPNISVLYGVWVIIGGYLANGFLFTGRYTFPEFLPLGGCHSIYVTCLDLAEHFSVSIREYNSVDQFAMLG